MNRQLFKIFFLSLLAVTLPATASAASFFPTSDMEINLSDDTTFNFDSYTISSDINVHYLAPADSFIEIISEGDITINGSLSFFGGSLSITSTTGSIFLNGDISILGDLSLIAGTVMTDSGGSNPGAGTITGSGGVTINGGGTLTTTGTGITLIPTNIIIPPGGIALTLNTPVPIPPSLMLFATGLIALSSGFKRRSKIILANN